MTTKEKLKALQANGVYFSHLCSQYFDDIDRSALFNFLKHDESYYYRYIFETGMRRYAQDMIALFQQILEEPDVPMEELEKGYKKLLRRVETLKGKRHFNPDDYLPQNTPESLGVPIDD